MSLLYFSLLVLVLALDFVVSWWLIIILFLLFLVGETSVFEYGPGPCLVLLLEIPEGFISLSLYSAASNNF